MFCTNCGQSVQLEDKFCASCGAAVRRVTATASSTAAAGIPAMQPSSTAEMNRPLASATPTAESISSPQPNAYSGDPVDSPRVQAAPPAIESQQCPQCGRLHPGENQVCDACAATPAATAIVEAPPRYIPTAFDLPYIEAEEPEVRPRRSRLPVLEILVAVLLLAGAAFAVWMLRSSLPGKSIVPPSNVEVTISPSTAEVAAGKAFDFAATVDGTDDAEVTWTVQEGDDGGHVVARGAKAGAGGLVSELAVYVAPSSAGTYHVLATSKADPRKSASAEITVNGR